MNTQRLDRRKFLAVGAAWSAAAAMPARAAAPGGSVLLAQDPARPIVPAAAAMPPGRLTFHGIDTFHGATIGTLKVDVAMLEGGSYRPVKSFNTATNGRSDGSVFEGPTFKPGRYELVMHVDEYYAALGTKLPTPMFLTRVPLRFGIADAAERYHIAVLFGPWSYAYYRGS